LLVYIVGSRRRVRVWNIRKPTLFGNSKSDIGLYFGVVRIKRHFFFIWESFVFHVKTTVYFLISVFETSLLIKKAIHYSRYSNILGLELSIFPSVGLHWQFWKLTSFSYWASLSLFCLYLFQGHVSTSAATVEVSLSDLSKLLCKVLTLLQPL
jgi:hypothetical protein